MNPTVSIIIPVYNAEDYLRRCVDSVLKQEYRDFELLLMDDGSKDSSGAICDEYGALDERVRVVHKENTGVSDTRNQGIAMAQGIYLQFLDSDDWITPDATKLLVRAAEEHDCDLVIADFYRVVGNHVSRQGDIENTEVLSRTEYAERMMEDPADFYYGVLWNKLYRRELVERHGLRMNEQISWCEDFLFNLEYNLYAKTFYALQTPIYYYVKRKGSLVSQSFSIAQSIKMKLLVFEYYNEFYKQVYDEKDYEKKRMQVFHFLIDVAGDGGLSILSSQGIRRLGEERSRVNPEVLGGDSVFLEFYRNRKLMERYLEAVALKYDLSIRDVGLLAYLKQAPSVGRKKELADFLGISVRGVTFTLQKLVMKEYIRISEQRPEDGQEKLPEKTPEKVLRFELLPAAQPILDDLQQAEKDFEEVRYDGLTEGEQETARELGEKMNRNIQRVLG